MSEMYGYDDPGYGLEDESGGFADLANGADTFDAEDAFSDVFEAGASQAQIEADLANVERQIVERLAQTPRFTSGDLRSPEAMQMAQEAAHEADALLIAQIAQEAGVSQDQARQALAADPEANEGFLQQVFEAAAEGTHWTQLRENMRRQVNPRHEAWKRENGIVEGEHGDYYQAGG